MNNQPKHTQDRVKEIIKKQLSNAYYAGLDHKGWSDYQETEAVNIIIEDFETLVREQWNTVKGNFKEQQ